MYLKSYETVYPLSVYMLGGEMALPAMHYFMYHCMYVVCEFESHSESCFCESQEHDSYIVHIYIYMINTQIHTHFIKDDIF